MKLNKSENKLIGQWLFENGKMLKDPVSERIEWLINHHLKKIISANGGWDILYRDPEDERYWELSYPQSELHGGGPPCLTNFTKEAAIEKYKSAI